MDKKIIKRIFITCALTFFCCVIWMLLELIIDGQIVNKIIDNIIMLLFVPIIFIATKYIIQ